MGNFKQDYNKYIKEQEMMNKAPDNSIIYEYCMKEEKKHGFGRVKLAKYAMAAAMSAAVITVVASTNVISYAYEAVADIINTYILKSKEADIADIKISENKDVFEKNFMNVADIAEEYDIEIMQSNLAYDWNKEYALAIGYGSDDKINGIRIIAPYYIMGDLPVVEDALAIPDETAILNPLGYGIYGDELYEGEKYQTPVYLSMFVNVSGENMEIGNEIGYEGVDVVTENYVSKENGMTFVITSTEFSVGEEIEGLNPMVKAVCIKDDVQYKLEGRVTVETMKEIIDSFAY